MPRTVTGAEGTASGIMCQSPNSKPCIACELLDVSCQRVFAWAVLGGSVTYKFDLDLVLLTLGGLVVFLVFQGKR
jgi:hypothetical protein